MIEVVMARMETGKHGTFSVVWVPGGVMQWVMGELPWKNNEHDVSCIPYGVYEVWAETIRRKDKPDYQGYGVKGVPDRTGIQIHRGNWFGDEAAGFKSQVQGCLLPGLKFAWSRTVIAGREAFQQRTVANSETALRQMVDVLGGKFKLRIVSACDEQFQVRTAEGAEPQSTQRAAGEGQLLNS